jgi:hypothetical protein
VEVGMVGGLEMCVSKAGSTRQFSRRWRIKRKRYSSDDDDDDDDEDDEQQQLALPTIVNANQSSSS